MLKINFSSSVDDLVVRLGKDIYEQGLKGDPFIITQIVTPNRSLQSWLQQKIADQHGIIANLDFVFWERFILNFIERDGKVENLLDRENLVFLILAKVVENFDNPAFEYLCDYLFEEEVLNEEALWEFSEKLAILIFEYENHRPNFFKSWLQEKLVFDDNKMEIIQQNIYYLLFAGKEGVYKSFTNVLDKVDASKVIKAKERIYFFCPTFISKFHLKSLRILSQFYDVHLYYYNLCIEYWQDMNTVDEANYFNYLDRLKEVKVISDEDGQSLESNPYENHLLQTWGKGGREVLKSFADLSNSYNFEEEYLPIRAIEENELSALRLLQLEVSHRRTLQTKILQDRSLQIWRADSQYIEVEAVYNSILSSLKKDKNLCFSDIAICCPNVEIYVPFIKSVFEHNDDLIYQFVDGDNIDDEFVEVMSLFINVLQDGFNRKNVLQLCKNQLIRRKINLHDEELALWEGWLIHNNILRYFDGQEKSFSWQQGLKRLRLGLVIDGVVDDWQTNSTKWSDGDSLAKLCLLVDMIEGVYKQAKFKRTLLSWSSLFSNFMTSFLEVDVDDVNVMFSYQKCHHFLNKLVGYDKFFKKQTKFSIAFIRKSIEAVFKKGSNRAFNHCGIAITSLSSMRPIPFKQVYVIGLQEKDFPGNLVNDSLDLRSYKRQIGDVNIVDRNKYCFLECVMTTKESLHLSYVSKDLYKNEELYPSIVIQDILSQVDKDFKIIDLDLGMLNKLNYDIDKQISNLSYNYSLYQRGLEQGEFAEFFSETEPKKLEMVSFQRLVSFVNKPTTTKLKNQLHLRDVNLDYLQKYEEFFGQQYDLANVASIIFMQFLQQYREFKEIFKGEDSYKNLLSQVQMTYKEYEQKSILPKQQESDVVLLSLIGQVEQYYKALQKEYEQYPMGQLVFLEPQEFLFEGLKINLHFNDFWFLSEGGKVVAFYSLNKQGQFKGMLLLLLHLVGRTHLHFNFDSYSCRSYEKGFFTKNKKFDEDLYFINQVKELPALKVVKLANETLQQFISLFNSQFYISGEKQDECPEKALIESLMQENEEFIILKKIVGV